MLFALNKDNCEKWVKKHEQRYLYVAVKQANWMLCCAIYGIWSINYVGGRRQHAERKKVCTSHCHN